MEKDGNRSRIISSNFNTSGYKEFEKFTPFKPISQSEVLYIVHSEPIKSRDIKIKCS